MDWTLGSILFYGGIAGGLLTLLLSVVSILALKAGKKKIIKKLNGEYGGKLK